MTTLEVKRLNQTNSYELGANELAMYRTLKDQGAFECPLPELEAARMLLADMLLDEAATEAEVGTAMASHVNAFQAQQLPEIWSHDTDLSQVRSAITSEVDSVAFLMLDKYGLDTVRVPSSETIGNLVWRYTHDDHAESLRKEDIRPYGSAATATLLGAVSLIEV